MRSGEGQEISPPVYCLAVVSVYFHATTSSTDRRKAGNRLKYVTLVLFKTSDLGREGKLHRWEEKQTSLLPSQLNSVHPEIIINHSP